MPSVIEEFVPELEGPFFEDPLVPQVVKKNKKQFDSRETLLETVKIFVPAGIGMLLVWLGLTTTGSYFIPASRFGGVLFEIFYLWQAGTLMAMVGAILVYDAIKRTGYL
jgi:hypothetical protein